MNSKYPRATAFLQKMNMDVDEALAYLEGEERGTAET